MRYSRPGGDPSHDRRAGSDRYRRLDERGGGRGCRRGDANGADLFSSPQRSRERRDQGLRFQAPRANQQGPDAGAAYPSRGVRPQLQRVTLGVLANNCGGPRRQRRPADLRRVHLQPAESHQLQSHRCPGAGRATVPGDQPADHLSNHRPSVGRLQRGGLHPEAAADAD